MQTVFGVFDQISTIFFGISLSFNPLLKLLIACLLRKLVPEGHFLIPSIEKFCRWSNLRIRHFLVLSMFEKWLRRPINVATLKIRVTRFFSFSMLLKQSKHPNCNLQTIFFDRKTTLGLRFYHSLSDIKFPNLRVSTWLLDLLGSF